MMSLFWQLPVTIFNVLLAQTLSSTVFIKMTKITADDRNLIKNLSIEKHWGAWRMKTVSKQKLEHNSVNQVIKNFYTDGTTERKHRPKSARN